LTRADNYHSFERKIDSWRERRKDSSDRKSYDSVFDKQNLLRVYKLFSDGVIDQFEFPISTGKEGIVFSATTPAKGRVAVKIYRTSNASFRDMAKYVQGDPRFKGITTNRRKLILAWAAKEYRNLQRLYEAGVRVPKPIAHHQNIVVMEYIGSEEGPAQQMREVDIDDPESVARKLFDYMRVAYQKAELVHGDLSEYNILMLGQEPVIIDVGQTVLLGHPMSEEFLVRDVTNLARFFRRQGIPIDIENELKGIRGR
jgi:RIO kinase 1